MTVERRAGESPGARSRCHQPHMTAPERQAPWPGHPRQSTADQHTRYSRAWPLACLRSPTARKGTTRGVPPLPTGPVPAGTVRHPGGCLQPVLLRGRVDHIDGATGELLHRYTTVHEPGGVLPIACKTRRASRCLPCAEVYRADTYQLIRAGLTGGKGIPEAVAARPRPGTPSLAWAFVMRAGDENRTRTISLGSAAVTAARGADLASLADPSGPG